MNVTEYNINREDHVQTKGNTRVQFFSELHNVQAWLASFMRALETDERSNSVHSAPSRLDAVGRGDRYIQSRQPVLTRLSGATYFSRCVDGASVCSTDTSCPKFFTTPR